VTVRIGMFAGSHVFDYRSSNENPYGALLVEALQKRGLIVERLQYQPQHRYRGQARREPVRAAERPFPYRDRRLSRDDADPYRAGTRVRE
jgi:hypothetical protein